MQFIVYFREALALCVALGASRAAARGADLHDGLAALAHGVLPELPREHQAHGRLQVVGQHGVPARHAGELACLRGQALEGVGHAGLHDGHRLLADAELRVDLLQDLEDVGRMAGRPLLLPLGGLGLDFGGAVRRRHLELLRLQRHGRSGSQGGSAGGRSGPSGGVQFGGPGRRGRAA